MQRAGNFDYYINKETGENKITNVATIHYRGEPGKKYSMNPISAVLSMSRALWGEVSPKLRASSIEWNQEIIHLFFYYDGEISEEDHESAECVATEVIAGFPEYQLEIDILSCDYPQHVAVRGELVYHRYEDNFHPPILNLEPELDQPYYPSLAAQQVLLGVVTPSLRGVFTDYKIEERKAIFCFIYDGEVTESLKHLANSAVNRARRAFPDNFEIIAKIERLDFSSRLNEEFFKKFALSEKTWTAYRRRET